VLDHLAGEGDLPELRLVLRVGDVGLLAELPRPLDAHGVQVDPEKGLSEPLESRLDLGARSRCR
jgi:hypothetical protein